MKQLKIYSRSRRASDPQLEYLGTLSQDGTYTGVEWLKNGIDKMIAFMDYDLFDQHDWEEISYRLSSYATYAIEIEDNPAADFESAFCNAI